MIEHVDKNKYKITVECGFINGKRKRKSKTIIGNKQDAKEVELELLKQVKARNNYYLPNKEKLTFRELANMFIKDYCKDNLKENTTYGYENLLKVILPEIGDISVEDITSLVLQRYYNKLKNTYNYSSNTIRHHYVLINNIFERCKKWKLISENPNESIDKPKENCKKAKFYNYEQLKKLLDVLTLEPITHRAPITLCIDTGMRREELNGLRWEHVDLDKGKINIKEVRLAIGKKIVVTTPKTEKSIRPIVITSTSLELLKKLKSYQENMANTMGNKWTCTGYVFVNEHGLPYYPDTLSKIFKKIVKKYNLDDLSLHKLRHTSASLLLNKKTDVVSVSERLGHSNTSTTLNIYSHAIENLDYKSAKKMNNILKNA